MQAGTYADQGALALCKSCAVGRSNGSEGSIAAAIIWMFVISILLFWLPFIGLLIAGVVGGRAAGGVGSALVAVLAPCVVLSVVMFFAGTLLSVIPVIGWIIGGVAAAGAFALILSVIGPLLLGAIIGGIMAQ